MQTENSVNQFLIDLAASTMAVEIEKAVLGPESTTTKPADIFAGAAAITTTHVGINDLIYAVESTKANTGCFITIAAIAKTLRNTEKNGGYLMEWNTINAFPCHVTESATGLAFGGWSDW